MAEIRPEKIYVLYDEISEEFWGPDGWNRRPCGVLCHQSYDEAVKLFKSLPKRLGMVIGECGVVEMEDNSCGKERQE